MQMMVKNSIPAMGSLVNFSSTASNSFIAISIKVVSR